MSRGNKRKGGGDVGGEAKRHKDTLNEIADEYICPITTELPLEPVIAKDGRIYERSAIEEHIERQRGALRSPATNEPMGAELLDAFQVRNSIEKLVKSRALSGDKARHWERRIKDEEYVASLKEKAENGDLEAIHELGNVFDEGLNGQKQDEAKAFEWWRKAADQDFPPAMGDAGNSLILGVGVAKNGREGMLLIGRAAEMGDPGAAYLLGSWYAEGEHGIPKNAEKAKEWLRKAISGKGKFAWNMGDEDESDARDLLKELSSGSDSAAAESSNA